MCQFFRSNSRYLTKFLGKKIIDKLNYFVYDIIQGIIMKKYLFFILVGFIIFPVYAQISNNNHMTMQLLFRNSRFFGYYLPLDFVEAFENSKDWFSSRRYIQESEYIYIRIDQYGIWVQEPITGDGYSEDLINNRNGIEIYFYEIINNEIIITNSVTGNKYKKISNDFDYDIPAIDNYIGRIVLRDFILSGELILDNNIITIPAFNFGKFRIQTWYDFSEYEAKLYLYSFDRRWYVDMDIHGNEIIIYDYERWIWNERSGKRIYWRNRP